jgi:predicted lipid-binding transport protein (Tim44 family)
MQSFPTILELLIFAALAAVVIYNLYAVLGRRIGRQPDEQAEPAGMRPPLEAQPARIEPAPVEVELSGLAALKAKDPSFDADKFLQGAKTAYTMIVRAFAAGDRQTLKGLLSPQAMAGFERAMAAREAEGRTESAEFEHEPRADLETGELDGETERVRVRFLAEFRSRSKGPQGEQVEDRRTAEVWTFERNLNSRDPNWTLVRVDAAEA